MVGALFINGGSQGWSEKYWLPDLNYPSAVTNFGMLCQWRASLLPDGFEMVWARVSFPDTKRDAMAAITQPLFPLTYPPPTIPSTAGFGPVNKTEDGLLFRFQTAGGRWSNRIIRGIPDSDITDDLIVGGLAIPGAPPLTVPALGTNTWPFYLANFVSYLVLHTVSPIRLQVKPPIYDSVAWQSALYRRTAMRRTGGPFMRTKGRSSK